MIYRNHWEIRLTNHAIIRANQRNICMDMAVETIVTGEIKRFGKNGIKFVRRFKDSTIVCVGEIKELNRVQIKTIERRFL